VELTNTNRSRAYPKIFPIGKSVLPGCFTFFASFLVFRE
jgi:hypothetical protein